MGRRAKAEILCCDQDAIVASHNGFGKVCKRRFAIAETAFVVEDWYDGEAVSYVHLADGVTPDRVVVEGAESVRVLPWKYSTEYNRFHDGKVVEIRFKGHVRYSIV